PVARVERSEIRDRRIRRCDVSGFRCAQSGLQSSPDWRTFMQRRLIFQIVVFAGLLVGLAISTDAARAQPARTIKILISVPPGGTIDFLVRVLADHIGKANG